MKKFIKRAGIRRPNKTMADIEDMVAKGIRVTIKNGAQEVILEKDVRYGDVKRDKAADDTVVTCVYCGHQYEKGTPQSKHRELYRHILNCKQHPLCKMLQMWDALSQHTINVLFNKRATTSPSGRAYFSKADINSIRDFIKEQGRVVGSIRKLGE